MEVASAQQNNVHARALGWPERPVPTVVGPAEAAAPAWFGPFWAGLAAVFGQALVLSVWFHQPVAPTVRARRARRRVLGGLATGRMWIWLALLVFVELWFDYALLVYGGNVWASAFGLPQEPDPFVPFFPFGAFALVLVGFLTLEPWRGLQLAFRCRWWPAVGVSATVAFGSVLYAVGRWAVAGAV